MPWTVNIKIGFVNLSFWEIKEIPDGLLVLRQAKLALPDSVFFVRYLKYR